LSSFETAAQAIGTGLKPRTQQFQSLRLTPGLQVDVPAAGHHHHAITARTVPLQALHARLQQHARQVVPREGLTERLIALRRHAGKTDPGDRLANAHAGEPAAPVGEDQRRQCAGSESKSRGRYRKADESRQGVAGGQGAVEVEQGEMHVRDGSGSSTFANAQPGAHATPIEQRARPTSKQQSSA
jgi:hypothetical protein